MKSRPNLKNEEFGLATAEATFDYIQGSLQVGTRVREAQETSFKLGRRKIDSLLQAGVEKFFEGDEVGPHCFG